MAKPRIPTSARSFATVPIDALQAAVSYLKPLCKHRINPNRRAVMIETRVSGELVASATNMEVFARLVLPGGAALGDPAVIVVDLAKIERFLENAEGEAILHIESNGLAGYIEIPGGHLQLPSLDANDFPKCPESPSSGELKVKGQDLARMVVVAAYATLREVRDARYAMGGVLVKIDDRDLVIVSTDGRRLALCRRTLEDPPLLGYSPSAVVPPEALNIIAARASRDGEACLRFSDSYLIAETKNSFVAARQVSGRFADYDAVIRPRGAGALEVDRRGWLEAVKRVSLFSTIDGKTGEKLMSSVIHEFGEDSIGLSCQLIDQGEGSAEVNCSRIGGELLRMGLNPTFLIETLRACASERVEVDLDTPKKSIVVRDKGPFPSLHVIMPIAIVESEEKTSHV